MRFSSLKAWLTNALADTDYAQVPIEPGPEESVVPGRHIVLTADGGLGLDLEDVVDVRSWQVKAVGEQGNYADAEDLALLVDSVVRSGGYTRTLEDGTRLVNARRFGAPPLALLTDDSRRTHFVCSYLFETPAE